jgi:hypothetical protein
MEVITLNSTNFIGLSAAYDLDPTIKFDHNVYYTEQGIVMPLSPVLANINDTSTNNYSNLFLTQSVPISSVAYIEDLQAIEDDGFSTYLAINARGGISDSSRFLVTQEPDISTSFATVSVSGVKSKIDNRYFFTVTFLDDYLCKVEHTVDGVTRYMTLDRFNTPNIFFSFDTGTDYLEDLSPQIFYYTYDKIGDHIVFSKNINERECFLRYDPLSPLSANLTLVDPITGNNVIPFTTDSIFSCIKRPEEPNNTKLIDPWVSYNPNFKTNTQDINKSRSFGVVRSNLLINSQYQSVTGTAMPINALSLKTTNTPENYQSRNNPFQANKSTFFSENDVEFRDYRKLFTGFNQLLGDDNISLGYEVYTTDITLPKNTVTYFHTPPDMYPFKQLNVNDSGLIEAGAIAGDHPVKSDKIFKKLADAKYTSPFGSTVDESNGSFLCSWLSGSIDPEVKPIWVDRYYNPSKITYISALTSRTVKAISYETVFDDLISRAGNIPGTDDVFDKPSDLVFEPSCYYAYHHYGEKDVLNFITSLQSVLVEKGISNYFYVNGSKANSKNNEYTFNGDTYAITNPLSGIQQSNQFTITFSMYNSDWSKPFGYQVLGNFLNDGFGVFNTNVVTPTIFFNSSSSINITNTDFTTLKSIRYTSRPLQYIRSNFGEDYSVVFSDGYIRRYTCDDILLRESFSRDLSSAVDYTNDSSTAFVLCTGTPGVRVVQVGLNSNTLSIVPSATTTAYFSPCAGSFSHNFARTVERYNDILFFTNGSVSRRVKDKIYYLQNGKSIIEWSNIDSSTISTVTAFQVANTQSNFADFNIDFDGNIWVITGTNTYHKYTQNKEFQLSGTLTSNTSSIHTVTLTGNGTQRTFTLANSGSDNPADYNVQFANGVQLRPVFDYKIVNNRLEFSSPPVSGHRCDISRLVFIDTFVNNKITFISEFANGSYINNALITRTGTLVDNTLLTPISTQAYQLIKLNMQGEQVSNTFMSMPTSNAVSLTNTNYLREHVLDAYPVSNLNIKTALTNIYNSTDTTTSEIIFNLSGLDPGYHHFAVRFDAYQGFMSLFVDGRRIGDAQFEPRKYKFSSLLFRPYLIGSACFNNSTPLFKYLKTNTYLVKNTAIKNFYLYDTPLNDFDILMHARESAEIQDIHFDIPCGRRNYIEEIERYFKASLPGSKSTQYNIVIRNTGITDESLKKALEERIAITLSKSAPVYSKLNKIKWVN